MPFVRPEQAGDYYRRMHRGQDMIWNLADEEERTQTGVAVQALCNDLRALFEVITPHPTNLTSYGTRIRQMLILACTEVEAAWAGVLRANSVTPKRPSTRDYVMLADPLELAEYSVRLRDYPSFASIDPFRGWSTATPAESLPWYDAYNRTKHDRESHSSDATLGHGITAVAGMVVMAAAQFGHLLFQPEARFGQTVFQLHAPQRHVLHTRYIPPPTGGSWKAIPYPFERQDRRGGR